MATIQVNDLENKDFFCLDCQQQVPELSHQCEESEDDE